jgi:hypothetical protein
MSDISIIHKTRDDSKVVYPPDRGDEWFRHVQEYNIFNDAQARLIADALMDVQSYARAERESEINDLVEVLRDWQEGIQEELDQLHQVIGLYRERVATLEGKLDAMTDLKGITGKQGERGEPGKQGVRGEKGDVGKPGASAPHWIGVKVQGFDLITVMSDGTLGPRISLEKMFGEFVQQMMGMPKP